MPAPLRRLSINIKLPLLVAGLLLAVVAIFATLAYRQVARVETADAVERLTKVAEQLSGLVSQQGQALRTSAGALAADPSILALQSDTSAEAVSRAVAVLSRLPADTNDAVTAEVRGRSGSLLALAPGRMQILTEAVAAAPPRPDSVAISPLYLYRDSVFYEVTAPLADWGWLVQRRIIANTRENVDRISQLFGTSAQLFLGNREGESVWTDYIGTVASPRGGDTAAVYQRGGEKRVGVFAPAANTPWIMGAEFPMSTVLANTHQLLQRFIILAVLIVALGALIGWLLSRQISRPLGNLMRAAEDVAAGRARQLPRTERNDEIGRLGESFRVMLDRVREGQAQLEQRVVELHQAQETVRGTLETLGAVFNASPLPIVALNRDERVEFWNLAAERVFGWPAEHVVGKPLPFIPDDLHQESNRLWEEALGGKVFTGLEVRRCHRDGTTMDMRLTVSAIYGADEQPTGVVAVYEDITERRRLEDHLRHVQRLDAIGKLAGGVAHDFNNLLTVILTEAELALPTATDGSREALDAVQQTALRASALTRQLLAFARRQPLKPEVFHPGSLVSDLEKMLRRLIGDHVNLVTSIPDDIWPVKADRGQIEQVITNLVVNARDAMPQGGKVVISARNRSLKPADVEGKPELEAGDWTEISVEDTGTGISEEVRARLFEPFFTTKEAGKGTGLGLATCHGIVQQSGGRILVESKPGKGTVFSVLLPRVTQRDEGLDQASSDPEEADAGGIVLLVEDYTELRSVAGRVLSRAGYQVIPAVSGEEALKMIEAGLRPDLLVSDIGLPGINGVRLAEMIRQVHPSTRVLLVSGSKDYAHLVRSLSDGTFLEKPYRVEELVRTVRGIFRQKIAKAS
jgi:PAS domain S-box-containing protein